MEEVKEYSLVTGTNDFRELISSNDLTADSNRLFVDKTLFIKEFLDDSNKVVLITRPRRWGKTITLSMVNNFLSPKTRGMPTAGLFQDLKIAQYLTPSSKYSKFFSQSPVISISFKDIFGSTVENIEKSISRKIATLYSEHEYILSALDSNDSRFGHSSTCTSDAKRFATLRDNLADVTELQTSLLFLSKLLYQYHGKRVFILIDEYDNVINNNFDKPVILESLTNFFKSLFSACLKDNDEYLEKGLITGILRIAKAGMLSGLNNLTEGTALDQWYDKHYGFTESETTELLQKAGLANQQEEIKNWFNGYLIGQERLYNPWSITQCISRKGKLLPYWVDTANPNMMKSIILDRSPAEYRLKISSLLETGLLNVQREIKRHISLEDILINPEALWSLMLHTGYLTLATPDNLNTVRLPNYEVTLLIREYIANWFTENPLLGAVAQSLLGGNIQGFVAALKLALQNPIYSARVFNNKAANSNSRISLKEFMYQFLVMNELYFINSNTTKDCEILSEPAEPSPMSYTAIAEPEGISLGKSRPDFIVLNHRLKMCLVGEIKVAENYERLVHVAQKIALQQINKNQYGKHYIERGYKLIKLGISFYGLDFEVAYEA